MALLFHRCGRRERCWKEPVKPLQQTGPSAKLRRERGSHPRSPRPLGGFRRVIVTLRCLPAAPGGFLPRGPPLPRSPQGSAPAVAPAAVLGAARRPLAPSPPLRASAGAAPHRRGRRGLLSPSLHRYPESHQTRRAPAKASSPNRKSVSPRPTAPTDTRPPPLHCRVVGKGVLCVRGGEFTPAPRGSGRPVTLVVEAAEGRSPCAVAELRRGAGRGRYSL